MQNKEWAIIRGLVRTESGSVSPALIIATATKATGTRDILFNAFTFILPFGV